MTSRQRFAETMSYGRPDRVPLLEEGLRDDVLEQWQTQGLPKSADPAEIFHYDRREEVTVDLGLRPGLKRWPTSSRGLVALRRRLDPNDESRLPADWPRRVHAWRSRSHLLHMRVHSGFFLALGVNDWRRFTEVIYLVRDAPKLVRSILELYGQFCAHVVERVAREVKLDFAIFSEPIGGNDRPLISPQFYRSSILPTYQPVLAALRKGGVRTVVFMTYANSRVLLPAVVEAGFDCLWACEAETRAMDYRSIRRQFGRQLRLIGGVDLDVLLTDRRAIRREMEAKAVPLLQDGGYVPLADGRVRASVPLRNYVYYRQLLEQLVVEGPGPSC